MTASWAIASLALLTGCASTWDSYPMSLYAVLKGGEPRAIVAHQQLLKKLVDAAERSGQHPPAGITAEYAYYSWKVGQPEVARAALAKEVQHYPQSMKFVAILERFLPSVSVVEVPKPTVADPDNGFGRD